MTFSERLLLLRREYKMTQAQLAHAIGVHERGLRGYELGSMQPTLPVIIALANHFCVSTDYLLGLTETRERQP